jgi:hypothetical protein
MKIDSSSFLALAAFAATCATLAIVLWQLLLSKRRLRRFQNLSLVPNVLLTRHPIVFVSQARSLFRMGGDFFELPVYLREHGYQVEEIEVRIKNLSQSELTDLLRRLLGGPPFSETRVHIVLSEAFSRSAYDLAFEGNPHLQSLTVLGEENSKSLRLTPPRVPFYARPDLRPLPTARNFQTELSALKHFVSLAESELR